MRDSQIISSVVVPFYICLHRFIYLHIGMYKSYKLKIIFVYVCISLSNIINTDIDKYNLENNFEINRRDIFTMIWAQGLA